MIRISVYAHLGAWMTLLAAGLGQPLNAQQTCFDGGIVVDYPDAGYTEGGAWEDVTGSYFTAGQSWTDVRSTGQDSAWAQWTAKLPAAGKYRVFFWHVPSTDTNAKIEVVHNGQTQTLNWNMQYGHLGWSSLGDYDFAAGSDASVKITHGEGKLLVDSVKFISLANLKPIPPLPPYPKPDGSFPHLDKQGNLLLSGQPYPVLYQETTEDTFAHPESIAANFDETFDIALAQGVNTLGTTLYWKTFETAPGVYDYTIIDALIEKARARNMHLSLVLFFAWRNLQSYYVPAYIAKDHATYLNDKLPGGADDPHYKVSPFADATRAAETKALTALFQRVLVKDPNHQVVIMAQIENEMPSGRDYSAPAMAAWNGPVPQQLFDFLTANEGSINRMIWNAWQKHGHKTAGTWAEVFGDDNNGSRVFGVWTAGTYIQSLITDLKKVLNVPYYMNAWQHESPSSYSYMDVFGAAVPSLDGMGPDAYGNLDKWEEDVGLSWRSWNHMTIAEQHHTAQAIWRAIGNYNAMISGEYYDVEGLDWLCSRETYDLLNEMAPLIASKRGTGDMLGFFQSRRSAGESWSEYFHDLKITYTATVRPHTFAQFVKEVPAPCEKINNVALGELDGCGLLISLGNREYVITSTRMDVTLSYINGGPIAVADAQTGHFQNGDWVSEGPASVQQQDEGVRFSFPTENRHYGQVRFKLGSSARNPAEVFEAERGKLLKEAEPAYSYGASGAFGVTNIKSEGDGVEFATHADFAANGLTMRYASGADTKATIFVNGTSTQDVDFPMTGSITNWAQKTIAISVPQGATVSIQAGKATVAPDLDCIMLSRDAPPAEPGPAPAAK
jgi:hypothetical protein